MFGSLLVSWIDLAVDGGGLLDVWGSSGVTLGGLTTSLGGLASEAIQPNSSHKEEKDGGALPLPATAALLFRCSSVYFFLCLRGD